MTRHNVSFVNQEGKRLTITGVEGPIYQHDIERLEEMANSHPEHKRFGPWEFCGERRTK